MRPDPAVFCACVRRDGLWRRGKGTEAFVWLWLRRCNAGGGGEGRLSL